MKIEYLDIVNFRGIVRTEFRDLGDTVIIAGPNGSGKSCVFDAIKFLKSMYGGYQQNEIQSWFGEFQINPSRLGQEIVKVFNDRNEPLTVAAEISFSDDEKEYITQNARELLSDVIWRSIYPEAFNYGFYSAAQYSSNFRDRQPEVDSRVNEELQELQKDLASPTARAQITAMPNGSITFHNSKLLSVAFNAYRPPHIGIIDYHGPMRLYGRENVQSITLSFDQNSQEQKRNTSLYNYNAKYGNVKAELAAAYVKEIFAKEADQNWRDNSDITETLKTLFETFFPDKEFLGPKPTVDGNLNFPVKLKNGSVHDLDELSSGEKEVLYGYLRMRNSAQKHSIILLDEPELHLNPRLIRGLPQFYRNNISIALKNQLWLVSHSDALLREAVGKSGYNVYHMVPCTSVSATQGQLRPLDANDGLDVAIVDLVGDVAAYRPGAKAVIFEGGGGTDFDQTMASTLFPELADVANLISGTNKVRVHALLETLNSSSEKGHLPTKFYAIVDSDRDSGARPTSNLSYFAWDAYHIENYLLEPSFIAKVWSSLGHKSAETNDQILDDLRTAARDVEPKILRDSMVDYANRGVIKLFNIGVDPAAENVSQSLFSTISNSVERVKTQMEESLSVDSLKEKYQEFTELYESSFADGSWRTKLPGREILKRYVSAKSPGVSYEIFRNLIMTSMADSSYQPQGMKDIINKILND